MKEGEYTRKLHENMQKSVLTATPDMKAAVQALSKNYEAQAFL